MRMETIRTILGIIQRNYNKHPLWAEESRVDWFQALQGFDDMEVEQAVRAIVLTRKTLPNVAAVIEFLQANRKGQDIATAQGCGACDNTGWREVVHWYSSRGKLQVTPYLAACDCPKGARLSSSTVPAWEAMVAKMRADPFTHAVYHGTHASPHLPADQRLHPEILQRSKDTTDTGRPVGAWQQLTGVE